MQIEEQQQQEPATEQPSAPVVDQEAGEASRDDLIEEAKKAAEGAAPSEGSTDESGAPDSPVEEEPNWKRIMQAREKAQAEREAAKSYAEEAKKRAEEEAKAIVEAARRQAAEEVEAERTRWRNRFQLDPEGALGELGGAEEVAGKVVDLNTPQGRELAKIKAELNETKKKAETAEEVRKEFEEFKRQQAEAEQRGRFEQAKTEFLSTHATKEKTPYLLARYTEDELVKRANEVAKEWVDAGIQFALGDIAGYLEHESKSRIASVGLPAQQVRAAESGSVASKVSANGLRATITAAAGSERRAAPKAFHEMSPDEQKADLLEVAKKAWQSAGGK